MARRALFSILAVAACSSAPGGSRLSTVVFVSGQNADAAKTDDAASARAEFHLERGNEYYGSGDLGRAAAEYESCLHASPEEGGESSSPPPQGCLINLASVLVDMAGEGHDQGSGGGQGGEESSGDTSDDMIRRAEGLYRRALAADPSDGDASFNLALLLQDRKTDAATREAASLYSVAVKSDPERWDAWANMASALSELKEEPLRAVDAYERAILLIEGGSEGGEKGEERDPSRDAYLSVLYYGYGVQLADLTPEACEALASAPGSLLIGDRQGSAAAASAEGDSEKKDGDYEAAADLCAENAHNALRAAADLDPSNVQAAHMLAAIEAERGGSSSASPKLRRATPAFVSALFDDFADTFDAKLGSLGYKVPRLVGIAAMEIMSSPSVRGTDMAGRKYRSALDAGCGTGLAGRYLRKIVDGPLIGVDISKKMLDIAAKCTTVSGCGLAVAKKTAEDDEDGGAAKHDEEAPPLYDGLMPLDLETMTIEQTLGARGVNRRKGGGEETSSFDLIVAADVLVYFGGIEALLDNFARLSSTGSVLIFSCERATDEEAPEGWRLLSSGRFAHAKSYVVGTAKEAGFELVGYEEIVPRLEKGEEVKGHLFRFVKVAWDKEEL